MDLLMNCLQLFLTFFKIGAFTFGGGYAMLPLVKQEVLINNWMTEEELLNFIAVAESTPGPVAINMATYVGVETAGVLGSIFATLGVVFPSFIVILIVAKFYSKYKNSFIVNGCLTGLRPVVIGLIGAAVISLGMGVLFPNGIGVNTLDFGFLSSFAVFGVVCLMAFQKFNPIALIGISAVMGICFGYFEKFYF